MELKILFLVLHPKMDFLKGTYSYHYQSLWSDFLHIISLVAPMNVLAYMFMHADYSRHQIFQAVCKNGHRISAMYTLFAKERYMQCVLPAAECQASRRNQITCKLAFINAQLINRWNHVWIYMHAVATYGLATCSLILMHVINSPGAELQAANHMMRSRCMRLTWTLTSLLQAREDQVLIVCCILSMKILALLEWPKFLQPPQTWTSLVQLQS